jgi:hypothetical protein
VVVVNTSRRQTEPSSSSVEVALPINSLVAPEQF